MANFMNLRVFLGDKPSSKNIDQGEANFCWAWFFDKATFTNARFYGPARFYRTLFYADALFDDIIFKDIVVFNGLKNQVQISELDLKLDRCPVSHNILATLAKDRSILKKDGESDGSVFLFIDISSKKDLQRKLNTMNVNQIDVDCITKIWEKGFREMFNKKSIISFRDTHSENHQIKLKFLM